MYVPGRRLRDVGLLADAGDMQGAAGIVTAILSALSGRPAWPRVVHPIDLGAGASCPAINAVLTAEVVVREKRATRGSNTGRAVTDRRGSRWHPRRWRSWRP